MRQETEKVHEQRSPFCASRHRANLVEKKTKSYLCLPKIRYSNSPRVQRILLCSRITPFPFSATFFLVSFRGREVHDNVS